MSSGSKKTSEGVPVYDIEEVKTGTARGKYKVYRKVRASLWSVERAGDGKPVIFATASLARGYADELSKAASKADGKTDSKTGSKADSRSGSVERPIDLEKVELALAEFRHRIVGLPRIPADDLRLSVAKDKETGEADKKLFGLNGVYILFYPTGRVARVGQAVRRPFGVRIADYDGPKGRWFKFRWVSVIPVNRDHKAFIDLLEAFLMLLLNPPENEGFVGEPPVC